jgi:hypothetical protein
MGGKPRFTPGERKIIISLCSYAESIFDQEVGGFTPGKKTDEYGYYIDRVVKIRKRLEAMTRRKT